MFIDNENTDSETSVEVDQRGNEEASENTMHGILTFPNTHAHFPLQSISILTTTKHINTYLGLYMVYANR